MTVNGTGAAGDTAKNFVSAGNGYGCVLGTNDFIVELLMRTPGSLPPVTNYIWYAKNLAQTVGIDLRYCRGGAAVFSLLLINTTNVPVDTGALSASTWYLVHYVVRRASSAQPYVNGRPSGSAVDVSAYNVDLSNNNNKGSLLGAPTQGYGAMSPCAYLAVWQAAGWLDSHRQDELIRRRWLALRSE